MKDRIVDSIFYISFTSLFKGNQVGVINEENYAENIVTDQDNKNNLANSVFWLMAALSLIFEESFCKSLIQICRISKPTNQTARAIKLKPETGD